MNSRKKQFVVYMIIAFGLAFITQGISCYFANIGNNIVFTLLNVFTMFAPTVAVLAAQKNFKGICFKPEIRGKIKYYAGAWVLPAVFTILGSALFFVVFPKAFDTTGMYLRQTLEAQVGDSADAVLEQMTAAGLSPVLLGILQMIQAITYAPLINGVVALGEEIGWRGYMTPYLKDKFGKPLGRLISGLIWGCWHWPLIIFAGYEYGTDYIGAPYLGPVAFCLVTVVFGTILDYLYEKTNCILVPALCHGAINAVAGVSMMFFNTEYSKYSILGPVMIGMISIVPMAICALIILIKDNKQTDAVTQ